MISPPKSRKEAETFSYGNWAGKPDGHKYDPKQCAYEVPCGGRSVLFHQCVKKPGHGPDGIYCKQHAKRLAQQITRESSEESRH